MTITPPPREDKAGGTVSGHIQQLDIERPFLSSVDAIGGRRARQETIRMLIDKGFDWIEQHGLDMFVSNLPRRSEYDVEDETVVIDQRVPPSGPCDREPPKDAS